VRLAQKKLQAFLKSSKKSPAISLLHARLRGGSRVEKNNKSSEGIPKLKAKKTKMRNIKLQHKWGHNKKTRLRDFSGYKSCVIKSSVKIKRGCVIFLVT
jgi:hypothetical protein